MAASQAVADLALGWGAGLRDLARAQAAGADPHRLVGALADHRPHRLEVRVEAPMGHVVGVADPIPELRALAADVAPLSHDERPPVRARYRPETQKPSILRRLRAPSSAVAGLPGGGAACYSPRARVMVQFNFSERTIKAKVVYYGPPQSGKTTNLEQIHRITDPEGSNRLISLNTAQDRTLFFDLLPFSLGTVSGYDFKIQLYTVPGQVQYNATRRVVLAGADAVVFVADSQKSMARENLTAFENMKVNLLANRLVPEKVPLVLQYNKQDLDGLLPRAELDRTLNFWGRKAFPAVAARGEGVMETFVAVVQDMLAAIALKYNLKEKGLDPEAVPEIVAQAFAAIVREGARAAPPPAARPRAS